MIQKDGSIILSDWHKGISQSPYFGFADMRNVENTLVSGVLTLGVKQTKVTSTTITGAPRWFAQNNDTNLTVYCLDTSGKVYSASSPWNSGWAQVAGNTTTNGTGNGLAIWKDYLFVARQDNIDTYGPLSSSPSWTSGLFDTTNDVDNRVESNVYHMFLVSDDDKLYMCNGRYIASLTENTTFSPSGTNGVEYTWLPRAITLPSTKISSCIAELGANIYVGTITGKTSYGINERLKVANIYPYSRSSLTLGIPIKLQEFGINQMIAVNTDLIVQSGNIGKFYKSNGSYFYPFAQIPRNSQISSPYINMTMRPGAIMYHKNKIFSGVQGSGMAGVYSFNLDGTGMVLENTTTAGENTNLDIGCLLAVRDQPETHLIGWADTDSATQGIDRVTFSDNFTTSYESYVDSQVFDIGTPYNKKTFNQIEIYLNKPLNSNEGVRFSYRTDMSASFTNFLTFDYATYSNKQSIISPFGITTEQIQFRISITGTTTSPVLKYIIIR